MTTTSFASLSGPDFLNLSRQQIKALSLDELQLLVLRSQKLLSTALFKPVQCLFEVMPDEFVLSIVLEWVDIEDLSRLDIALTNHHFRVKYLHLLQKTVHKGVLSVSRNGDFFNSDCNDSKGYDFNSGVAEWLEDRNIFMRTLRFYWKDKSSNRGVIPAGFLASTGQQLLSLTIADRTISDAAWAELLKRCPRLEDVRMGCNENITDVGASNLAHFLPKLHYLCICETKVTDIGLGRLGEGCIYLKYINLEGCKQISDAGLAKLAEGCQGLESVVLISCDNISDVGVNSLAQHCPHLHSLYLAYTKVTDMGLTRLGEGSCRALKFIDLGELDLITDTGLRKLAKGCPRLEDVNLEGCTKITDVGIASLAHNCVGLHTLYLSQTQVTDTGLASLGEGCKALRRISLDYLDISEEGILKLAEGCSMLERVGLDGIDISDDGYNSLRKSCPKLYSIARLCNQGYPNKYSTMISWLMP